MYVMRLSDEGFEESLRCIHRLSIRLKEYDQENTIPHSLLWPRL